MENKFSKILIIAGIAIAIIGGIIFMNVFTAETQKKDDNTDNSMKALKEMVKKQKQMMKVDDPEPNPFLTPSIIIMVGAGLIAAGFLNNANRD